VSAVARKAAAEIARARRGKFENEPQKDERKKNLIRRANKHERNNGGPVQCKLPGARRDGRSIDKNVHSAHPAANGASLETWWNIAPRTADKEEAQTPKPPQCEGLP
jgi:hypothetical protein